MARPLDSRGPAHSIGWSPPDTVPSCESEDNSVSAPTTTPITVNPLTTAGPQSLISTGAIINLAAADDSALPNMVTAINGQTVSGTYRATMGVQDDRVGHVCRDPDD